MESGSATFEFIQAAHAVSDWRFLPAKPGKTPEETEYSKACRHPVYINRHERKKRRMKAQPGAILKIVASLEKSAGPEYQIKPSRLHLSGLSFFRVPLTDRGIGQCVKARLALEARRGQQGAAKQTVAIFSSPLERAIQTAILATPFEDLKQCDFTIVLLPQLQECVRHPCDVVTSRRIISEQVEIVYKLHLAILAGEDRPADAEALRAKGGITVDFSRMGWKYERELGWRAGKPDGQGFDGKARRPCEVLTETADMALNRAWALRRFLATDCGRARDETARFLLYTHAGLMPLITGLRAPGDGCMAPLEMTLNWDTIKTGEYALVKADDARAAKAASIGIDAAAMTTGEAGVQRIVFADAKAIELARAAPRRRAIVLLNEREAEGYEPRRARLKRAFIHAMGRTAYVRQPEKEKKVARAAKRERLRQKKAGHRAGEVQPPVEEDYFPTCCASGTWNAEAAVETYRATFKKNVNTEDWPVERELRERDVW